MFTAVRPLQGITHITDSMGVSFTLIEGSERAVLFDTGYGMEDVSAYVGTLTHKPVRVLLSHGHHDHVLGARWFPDSFMAGEDLEEFCIRTGRTQRTEVKRQAEEKSVNVPPDYLTADIPIPVQLDFTDKTGGFDSTTIDLGMRSIRVIKVPGHTPGSIVLFVQEYGLLLTGDDWNPCTWMWFPTSLSAKVWRDSMSSLIRSLEKESGKEIIHVICSHQPSMREGKELKAFLSYMTDERMNEAPPVDMGAPLDTHLIAKEPEGWTLIFDQSKTKA